MKPPNTVIPIITSTHSTSITDRPTEDTDVITEDYSKKNVKGSRHFERLEKIIGDEITSPIPQEDSENYTVKEILKGIETTKESISLSSLSHNATNDVIDNEVASTSPGGPIISTSTLKYITIVDIIKDVTLKSIKESASDSTDGYYSSNKFGEVDIATNSVTTSTLSNELEENAFENSTEKYERELRIDAFSATPNFLPENPSAKYFSDKNNYSDSQFEVTSDIISTSPTRSDSKEDRDTENSTTKHLNYEESTVTEDNATLINEIITRESSPPTISSIPLLDEKFSTTTKVQRVMKI